jgi:hypothetical protein
MAALLLARLIFPVILVALVTLYAWTAYQTEKRK